MLEGNEEGCAEILGDPEEGELEGSADGFDERPEAVERRRTAQTSRLARRR